MACENCDCGRLPTAGSFYGAGEPCPRNAPYRGREYPYDPATERGIETIITQGRVALLQEDSGAGTGITRFEAIAQETPNDPYLSPAAIVVAANVPSGQQVLRIRARVGISDPTAVNTVNFAIYNGTNQIQTPWDGATNQVIEPHMGGGLARGGTDKQFTIRAIIVPRRWSNPAGADPLRSQMYAYAMLELWTVTSDPTQRGC